MTIPITIAAVGNAIYSMYGLYLPCLLRALSIIFARIAVAGKETIMEMAYSRYIKFGSMPMALPMIRFVVLSVNC